MFRKLLDEGTAGDNVGIPLRGVEKTDVERGQVLAKPGSMKAHTKFKGEVYILSKDEGAATRRSQQLPPAVLHPDHRRDRVALAARRREMVIPGDEHQRLGRAADAGGHRKGRALCHPRGRPHGGRRDDHRDRRLDNE